VSPVPGQPTCHCYKENSMANHPHQLTAQDLWHDIHAVRTQSPLVHSITNFVVMNLNANVLLAAGASPVMAHAHEEVKAMVGIAQSVVLNIGTLEPYWVDSMKVALAEAQQRGIPTVLDPVGAGATPYRNQTLNELLAVGHPSVIRGNGSEIMSTANAAIQTRGVDSSASANDALGAAQALTARTQGTVCVSGETDHILDAHKRWARLSNGHVWMTKITGVGCSSTALIGALCGAARCLARHHLGHGLDECGWRSGGRKSPSCAPRRGQHGGLVAGRIAVAGRSHLHLAGETANRLALSSVAAALAPALAPHVLDNDHDGLSKRLPARLLGDRQRTVQRAALDRGGQSRR
jgi:hydroxyethylthiazole kinase